jgi:hypothetical protein
MYRYLRRMISARHQRISGAPSGISMRWRHGRREQAREISSAEQANRHGLLAEHIDPVTGEQWGNFVQTYSMAGIIRCAIRLSTPWDQAF